MSVNIHGKQYITVAERVQEAGKDFLGLDTEVLSHEPVVIKATVKTIKGTFTGISYANTSKTIEAQSPYEVAETSAVGRALGFAGYGVIEGIASADEMVKAETQPVSSKYTAQREHYCNDHQRDLKLRETPNGIVWDHRLQIEGVWNICYGDGKWKPQKPYDSADMESVS